MSGALLAHRTQLLSPDRVVLRDYIICVALYLYFVELLFWNTATPYTPIWQLIGIIPRPPIHY